MKLFKKLKSLLKRLDQIAFKFVKLGIKVDWFFLFLFYILGRISLVVHYGWNLWVIILLDLWLYPLIVIVRKIAAGCNEDKNYAQEQEKPGNRV